MQNLTDREKIINSYISGYNHFDIDIMVTDLDDNVIFENIQNGITTMTLYGKNNFISQAERAKTYFSARTQTIQSIEHHGHSTIICIAYHAILDKDLPDGLKKGQELFLTGRSIFEFNDNKIIKLTDIS